MTCSVPDCGGALKAYGFCDAHYRRFRKYGDPLGGRTANGAAPAFLEKAFTHDSDDCLLWPYATLPSGHGTVTLGRRKQIVSRVICERVYGAAPAFPEMHAAHSCRNTGCINPRHLSWETPSENQMDRVRDGTSNRGERHPIGRLTEAQVREIRLLVTYDLTDAAIAKRYAVTRENIRDIRLGKIWSWLS